MEEFRAGARNELRARFPELDKGEPTPPLPPGFQLPPLPPGFVMAR
jgi:hypothetical protein